MNIKRTLLIGFLALSFLALACRRGEEIPEDLVAQVNDRYLRLAQVKQSVPQGLPEDLALSLKKNIISKWVENETLYQMALEEGVSLSEYQDFLVQEYRKSLIIQNLVDQKINKSYTISHQQIEEYYKNHQDEFRREEDEAHIIHLFMDQYDQAIFREIKNAKDLMAIIKKYYFDEKSSIEQPNGDLGYVPLSQLPDPIVKTIKRLKTGKISRPVKIGEGYHFIQLIDYQKKGTVRSLDVVKDEIILRLKKRARDEKYQELVRDAQQKVQIQTYLSKIQ
ncbi:peptidyl-prolyl cis-trans isomerase [Calditrichota bacterium LG25]